MSVARLSPDSSQVNVSNSILRHFGCNTYHESFKPLDELLATVGNRKICFMLFDGFGKFIQKRLKKFAPFIFEHQRFDVEAVYPPTTVAATTALLSGKYPIETGWLGWTQYFAKEDEYVQMFSGILEGTADTPASVQPAAKLPYNPIVRTLADKLGADAVGQIMGFDDYCKNDMGYPSCGKFFENTENLLRQEKTRFIYAYWTEPDHTMHSEGIYSENVKKAVNIIDRCMAQICERNPDVVFLTIADHGHTPVTNMDIRDYPDFMKTLVEPRFSIEGRLATFFVKKGSESDFEKAYRDHFSKDFELYTRQQILDEHIFGYGTPNPAALEFIGDYTLIAIGNRTLIDGFNYDGMVSNHAGATEEERIVSLGVYNA